MYLIPKKPSCLEVDHQVYSDGEGIRNCGCAFWMDEVLETGLNNQPWSDSASICPLNGAFEISHRNGHARRIPRLFCLLETRGIRAVSYSHCREILRPAGHQTVCHQ